MTDNRDNDQTKVLAAEFAAGLLDGKELDEARRRAAIDPEFARDVARWRGIVASFHQEVEDIAPPAKVWTRISQALGTPPVSDDNVKALHKSVALWRSAAAAMTAIAAGLAFLLVYYPRTILVPAPMPAAATDTPMVALMTDEKATKVMLSWDPSAKQLVFAVAGQLPGDAAHSHELWIIPTGGRPRSLGTLPGGKLSHKRLADALANLLQKGATIAISVEPRGGSPTGAPTGPVVASGPLAPA